MCFLPPFSIIIHALFLLRRFVRRLLLVDYTYTGNIYEVGLVDFHEIDGPNFWFSRRPVEDAQQVLRSYFSSCIRLFGVHQWE